MQNATVTRALSYVPVVLLRDDRQIVRQAKTSRRLSAEKLAIMVNDDHGVTISKVTVRNRIKD
ncbi:Uncharacterized protein PHPALM_1114 [Phytophthora palmivora]|uniref:Transposase Tc1-like domain-containing protein n=1 Tax=Phytophthora palmivora TaxID=4796 RepID=A0A2P4YT53_9STRA|nr:Uncharacterized protein PHPALM_1114 [Phytophthora palmivora]